MSKKLLLILLIPGILSSCDKESESPQNNTRTYLMGFQNSAPRFDSFELAIKSLNLWTTRADAAIISTEVPWDSLLSGKSEVDFILENYKELVNFYRSKNLKLWVYLDPQNGLNRTSDSDKLVAAGKSIAQPEIQALFRRFAVAMDSILQPEHMGLALETNLIREASPDSIYQGVRQAANGAAEDLLTRGSDAKLSVSVQVETAWGKLGNSAFKGIDQDLKDFPFAEELGLSSYAYLAYEKPADIPPDYYSKLIEGKSLDVFVAEGGWSSGYVNNPSGISFNSSPQIQSDYISYHAKLLDKVNAIALFQLTFTDIDPTALPGDIQTSIDYFLSLGLVDIDFQPKPALSTWDALFKRSYKQE